MYIYICLFKHFKNKKMSNIEWGGKKGRSRLNILSVWKHYLLRLWNTQKFLLVRRFVAASSFTTGPAANFAGWQPVPRPFDAQDAYFNLYIYTYIYVYTCICVYICLFKHFKNKKISNIEWGGKTGRSRLDILSVWKHYLLRLWNTEKFRDFVTRTASPTWWRFSKKNLRLRANFFHRTFPYPLPFP